MSVENARRLVQKIGSDPLFRARLTKVAAADKRVLLESAGFGDVTAEQVQAAASVNATGELTDVELEAVAGGSKWNWVMATIEVVGAAASAAAA